MPPSHFVSAPRGPAENFLLTIQAGCEILPCSKTQSPRPLPHILEYDEPGLQFLAALVMLRLLAIVFPNDASEASQQTKRV